MKANIKKILREGIAKNALGVDITRPDQMLIIMRGIPGSGKSTKAKELVGEGIIHSTDDVIESWGDYKTFFEKMVESKNFGALGAAHGANFKNAVKSMKEGLSPVIIDNTNIKKNEAKPFVKAALELGFSDANIRFVDIGTGGLLAEQLAKRNTHGVPLDKIETMIASHAGQGSLTLENVLGAKDMYKSDDSDILYSAVVLDEWSKQALLSRIGEYIPAGWKVFAHHMTIAFGKGVPNKEDLGKEVTLIVTALGESDMAMAVKVEGYPSANAIPHITIAIDTAKGGKPVMYNQITNWQKMKSFNIKGRVTEIKKS